jgi:SNF2 family DNA or RNA helicase
VLENWDRELQKWCPSFSIIMFHGAGRTAYSKELSSLGRAGCPAPFNVLLVGYSLFDRRRFVVNHSFCVTLHKVIMRTEIMDVFKIFNAALNKRMIARPSKDGPGVVF